MRHEPKNMTPTATRVHKDRMFRTLKCDECGIVGGDNCPGSPGEPAPVCCGFDDDTGRPCRPLPVTSPAADTPVFADSKPS